MEVVITRKNSPGGGEDRIALSELLRESGYAGEFEVTLCDVSDDDYIPLTYLVDVNVKS